MGTVSLQSADRFLHKGLIERVKQCICMEMIIFYFVERLSQRPPVCSTEQPCGCGNAPQWSHRLRIKPIWLIILQLFLKMVHDLMKGSVSDGLCLTIQTDQAHCTLGLWSKSTIFSGWVSECMNTVSIYRFSSYITAVWSVIEVSWEERVYYLLQLSALFAVLCQSSAGLPLNAIRLRLWMFAFFNYGRNAFWSMR